MPTKKKEPEPPWQVILEEIRSQNRATIEAVETNRESLEERMDQIQRATEARFDILEKALSHLDQESRSRDACWPSAPRPSTWRSGS